MIISLTKAAVDKLKEIELTGEQSLRIDASVSGGCGLSLKFKLLFDEPRQNDTVIEYNGIQIQIDRFTKRYLDEVTEIDYTDEHGFLVGESLASSACSG